MISSEPRAHTSVSYFVQQNSIFKNVENLTWFSSGPEGGQEFWGARHRHGDHHTDDTTTREISLRLPTTAL